MYTFHRTVLLLVEFILFIFCYIIFQINPRINVTAILTPVHLKEQSMVDARDMVARNSTTPKDPKIIDLITDLMSLMLQVKVIFWLMFFILCFNCKINFLSSNCD